MEESVTSIYSQWDYPNNFLYSERKLTSLKLILIFEKSTITFHIGIDPRCMLSAYTEILPLFVKIFEVYGNYGKGISISETKNSIL